MISQSETDKRNEILQAALKLFSEFGFHGTPTSKIAQVAGVANGTLFHYFKTKEELIVNLYIHLKAKLVEFTGAGLLQGGAGIKDKCKWMYINTLRWGLQNPQGFRFIQQFSASPFLSLIAPEEVKRQTAPVITMIEEGIAQGVIKPMPADLFYTIVSSHIYGINEYLLQAKLPAAKQEELINNSFEMVWKMTE